MSGPVAYYSFNTYNGNLPINTSNQLLNQVSGAYDLAISTPPAIPTIALNPNAAKSGTNSLSQTKYDVSPNASYFASSISQINGGVFSVSCWVYYYYNPLTGSVGTNNPGIVWTIKSSTNQNDYITLACYGNGTASFGLQVKDDNNYIRLVWNATPYGSTNLVGSGWVHVVVTYDSNTVLMYINNNLVSASSNIVAGLSSTNTGLSTNGSGNISVSNLFLGTTANLFVLGVPSSPLYYVANNGFCGLIAELNVYNRVLSSGATSGDIYNLYNIASAPPGTFINNNVVRMNNNQTLNLSTNPGGVISVNTDKVSFNNGSTTGNYGNLTSTGLTLTGNLNCNLITSTAISTSNNDINMGTTGNLLCSNVTPTNTNINLNLTSGKLRLLNLTSTAELSTTGNALTITANAGVAIQNSSLTKTDLTCGNVYPAGVSTSGSISCGTLGATTVNGGTVVTNTINPASGTTISTGNISAVGTGGSGVGTITCGNLFATGNNGLYSPTLQSGTTQLIVDATNVRIKSTTSGASKITIEDSVAGFNSVVGIIQRAANGSLSVNNSLPTLSSLTLTGAVKAGSITVTDANSSGVQLTLPNGIGNNYGTIPNKTFWSTSTGGLQLSRNWGGLQGVDYTNGLNDNTTNAAGGHNFFNHINALSWATIRCGGIELNSGNIGSVSNISVTNVNCTRVNTGTIYATGGIDSRIGFGNANTWNYCIEWGGYWTSGRKTNEGGHDIYLRYTIYADSNVVSNGSFYSLSDERTKTNVVELIHTQSLNIVRNLKPVTYEYIDRQGNKLLGFIAQELRESLPTAISLNKNYIPNIYELVKITNKNTIHLDNKCKMDFDLKYKIIKLKFLEIDFEMRIKKELFGTIKEFIDDKTFTINEDLNEQFLVLYGQEVDDINCLDYNQTNVISISAIKQIDLELQETKETVLTHVQQIDAQQTQMQLHKQQIDANFQEFQSIVNSQQSQIDSLTAELTNLKTSFNQLRLEFTRLNV